MSYASNGENERLQKLRTELENIITVIEAEQKILKEEIKPIRQKVAILELKKSVRRRRDELDGLPIQRAKKEDKENKRVRTCMPAMR
jgi:oligoendopeptidase F